MSAGEAETLAANPHAASSGPASFLDAAPGAQATTGGPVLKPVSQQELKDALVQGATVTYNGEEGKVSMKTTHHDEGTRNHLVGTGAINANGPYGGPNTFEGGPAITFTVTVNDPSLIFFRWDFNNDGIFDYPDQTGGGNMGKWTTDTSVSREFFDDYFGKIVVQGWDGVSTTVVINTGDNGLSQYNIQYLIGFGTYTFANRIQAKTNMKVTQLGHYHYAYNLFQSVLYSGSGTLLAQCTPTHVTFQWNWCSLSTPVNLVTGQEYVFGVRTTSYGNLISATSDTDRVHYMGLYYCFSSSLCYPNTFFSASYTLMADFKWEETLIFPDAAVADATLDVNNVAPSVFGVTTSPNPALEGNPAQLSAQFSDPGSGDTWEYRWTLHDGRVSPWLPVSKFNGGAKVLWLHTWTGSINGIVGSVGAKCGNFCTKVDIIDWGPLGTNAIPALSTLQQYDVVLVGTNYFHYMGDAMGDRLADYMDTGGNVVTMQFALDNAFGCNGGICGRFEDDGYSPVPRGYSYGAPGNMGTIYVPGHPLLDGVASLGTNAYSANIFDITPGATRIVDWNNGRVLAAANENPNGNGARAVALNFFPPPEYGAVSGDIALLISNSIRYASRQPEPTIKTMPITLDSFEIAFKDDDPTTTTLMDSFPVKVEVRDDDHGKVRVTGSSQLSFNDFENTAQCNGAYYLTNTWPPGWSSNPNPYGWVCTYDGTFGSRSPGIWYYYNDPAYGTGDGHSFLSTPSFSFSSWFAVRLEFNTYWQGNFPSGDSDGLVEASLDGGATWTVEIKAFHHNNPASFRGAVSVDSTAVGGASSVQFRFRYESNDDWWWFVDNIRITGLQGSIVSGLGEAVGQVTVANVAPTAIGGFPSALRTEAQGLEFLGFEISDPALLEPTEWFAYSWNFDDATPTDWKYVGTLAPPRSKILLIHTICLGLVGSTCPDLNGLRNTLLAQDDVASVDIHNFINYPATPIAPTLSQMLQYDVIIVATNWAYFSFAPFDLARRQVGDRLAQYLDSDRGGALTMMCVYCLSGGNDLFNIRGRYLDDQYGAYENANYLFPGASGIDIVQDHDAFVKVEPDNVGSMFIHAGNQDLTVGGNGNAAGQNGVSLATWKDGTSAVGIKELNNGKRTAHFGAFANPTGSSTGMLLRNLVGWVAGGIPSPKIAPFTHTWGDNGRYDVDLSLIDDDMGFVWDTAANLPVAVLPEAVMAHRLIPVTVDNVDPTISLPAGGVQAYLASNMCLRVAGREWGTVSLKFYTDGALSTSVQVTRAPGSPNSQAKCALARIDVLAAHTWSATVEFTPLPGKTRGSNPFWVIFDPWRNVNPGHGTTVFSGTFKVQNPAGWLKSMDLPNLRRNLFDSGRGAPVEFAATASDPGTDDLAFVWMWSDGTPETINIHMNLDGSVSQGVLANPQYLGFGEPYFDRPTNDIRSPEGTMHFTVRDTATHRVKVDQNHDGDHDCGDDDAIGLPGTQHGDDDDDCGDGHHEGRYHDDWDHDGDWRNADDDDCDDDDDDAIGLPGTQDDDDDCGDSAPQVMWVVLIVLDDDNSRGYPSLFFHDGTDMEFFVVQLS